MIQNNWPKNLLVMFFVSTLFSINYADGMFNNQGQWICSKDIDIEINYYDSYTATFQKVVDEVYFNDGARAAQSYFESAVDEEVIGQDWRRSQVCLIRLGIDTTELSQIIIPVDETQKLPNLLARFQIDEIDNSSSVVKTTPRGEIPPLKNYEPKPTDDIYYFEVVVVVLVIGVIVTLATSFFIKSRTKYQNPKTNPKDYEKNDETKDEEHYESIEIEINGGIEK